jgi:hypothetical protein
MFRAFAARIEALNIKLVLAQIQASPSFHILQSIVLLAYLSTFGTAILFFFIERYAGYEYAFPGVIPVFFRVEVFNFYLLISYERLDEFLYFHTPILSHTVLFNHCG